ncbi:hypothetical protein J1605_003007 [Eschrichtius robustus]|uniref:Uncharacterized protein n=1 Tax=Eschrichtius robustus TaxID=9764 RepID=A0AB34HUB8_ESCRO|nr:hypothetical protein J1605_003007 [Eschrichtius robustus]
MATYKAKHREPVEQLQWLEQSQQEPRRREEVKHHMQVLQDAGYEFDICFTMVQEKAIWIFWTALDANDQVWPPIGTVNPLEGLSEEATVELHLPTGSPTVYELDKNLKPIKPMEFLGNEEPMCEVMEAVAAQGKAKKRRQHC